MLVCIFLPRVAIASFLVMPLEDVIHGAAGVVDATIISIRTVGWRLGEKTGVCGVVYEAQVSETFKGSYSVVITFASDTTMPAHSRHLLFLKSYDGDFPRDFEILRPAAEEAERQACLSKLPRLKSDWLHAAEFLLNGFVSFSRWIEPSRDLTPILVEVKHAHVNGKSVPLGDPFASDASAGNALLFRYPLRTNVVRWEDLRVWLLRITSETANNRFQGDAP